MCGCVCDYVRLCVCEWVRVCAPLYKGVYVCEHKASILLTIHPAASRPLLRASRGIIPRQALREGTGDPLRTAAHHIPPRACSMPGRTHLLGETLPNFQWERKWSLMSS